MTIGSACINIFQPTERYFLLLVSSINHPFIQSMRQFHRLLRWLKKTMKVTTIIWVEMPFPLRYLRQ
jgi:hypothetical protein